MRTFKIAIFCTLAIPTIIVGVVFAGFIAGALLNSIVGALL